LRLLVYAMTPRDVGQGALGPLLKEAPWIKRRVEAFNVDGFLTEVSAAFRYSLLFRRWLEPGRPEPFVQFPIRDDGFFPCRRTLGDGDFLTGWELGILSQGGRYDVRAFSGLVDLTKHGNELVVAELPLPPAVTRARNTPQTVQRDDSRYRVFRSLLAEKATRVGAVLVEAPPPDEIPADGWADYVHMNARGAAAYSGWLGARSTSNALQAELDAGRSGS
jgi:hypothetical protein